MANNFIETAADFWSSFSDDDHGNNSRDRIRSLTIIPSSPLLPHPFPLGSRWRRYDPWEITDTRLVTEPPGLFRRPLRPHLPLNNLGRDQYPLTIQSSPNIPTFDQNNVLKKLRKEVYNPPPKNMFRRLSLYYRDNNKNNNNIVNDDDGCKSCAVCLEDFEARETVMVTPCNHMFHEDCIVPWVKSQGKCPVCRHQLHDGVRGSGGNSYNEVNREESIEELMSIIRGMEDMIINGNRGR